MESFKVKSQEKTQFIDITGEVNRLVESSGVREGICLISAPHTTAGISVNENADPSVMRDLRMELNKIVPFEDGYTHYEGNAAAHIKSTLVGSSLTLPVSGGRLALGTWQGVYFCEFDGPRSRIVQVQLLGSAGR